MCGGPYLATGSATATHTNCILYNEELGEIFFQNTFHSHFPDILITIQSPFFVHQLLEEVSFDLYVSPRKIALDPTVQRIIICFNPTVID